MRRPLWSRLRGHRGLWGAVVLTLVCVAVGACAGQQQARVSDRDARAIFAAIEKAPLVYAPGGCFNVRRPVGHERRRAYAIAIAVAAKDPDAELQSPDFVDDHPPIREWIARGARMIGLCLDEVPTAGAGWRALKGELDRAVRDL